jgi:hypothetical protein
MQEKEHTAKAEIGPNQIPHDVEDRDIGAARIDGFRP